LTMKNSLSSRFSSFLLLSSLALSDATIYEPELRTLLGTASRFCEATVLKLRHVPLSTVLNLGVIRVIRRCAHAMYKRHTRVDRLFSG
jgi:hypothetical protein